MSSHRPDGRDAQEEPGRELGDTQNGRFEFDSRRTAKRELYRLFKLAGGEEMVKAFDEKLSSLDFHETMMCVVKLVTYYEHGVLRRLRIHLRYHKHSKTLCGMDLDDGGKWILEGISHWQSVGVQATKAAFVTLKGVCMQTKNVSVPIAVPSKPKPVSVEAQLKIHLDRLACNIKVRPYFLVCIDAIQGYGSYEEVIAALESNFHTAQASKDDTQASTEVPSDHDAAARVPSTDSDNIPPRRTRKRKASLDLEDMPMRVRSAPAGRSTRISKQVSANYDGISDTGEDQVVKSENTG